MRQEKMALQHINQATLTVCQPTQAAQSTTTTITTNTTTTNE